MNITPVTISDRIGEVDLLPAETALPQTPGDVLMAETHLC
jgi:hypothetical protein